MSQDGYRVYKTGLGCITRVYVCIRRVLGVSFSLDNVLSFKSCY